MADDPEPKTDSVEKETVVSSSADGAAADPPSTTDEGKPETSLTVSKASESNEETTNDESQVEEKPAVAETTVVEEQQSDAVKTESEAAVEGLDSAETSKEIEEEKKTMETSQGDSFFTPKKDTSIANSKSAKLLINRFSTWREKTSENAQSLWSRSPALQENAKALWQQGKTIPAVSRLAAMAGGNPTTKEQAVEGSSVVRPDPERDSGQDVHTDGSGDSDEGNDAEQSTEDDDDNTNENPIGSSESDETETAETAEPRVRVGVAVSKAAAAASVVAESVATNFRGRYSANKVPVASGSLKLDTTARPKSAPESQTSLILKSRAAKHMQEILEGLDNHEFAMLLGTGMLGVNLKQCYLKNHGVFVDFLVAGGQAQMSGVIRTGDLLVRLGDVDLRKGTIAEIPQTIASTKRPVVLTLATGTKVALDRLNYIDVVVAMMHRGRKRPHEVSALESHPNLSEEDATQQDKVAEAGNEQTTDGLTSKVDEAESTALAGAGDEKGPKNPVVAEGDPGTNSTSTVTIPSSDGIQSYASPPTPTLAVRKEFAEDSALRCYDKFSVTELCDLAAADSNFRAAARNAFLLCAIDSRRLPFLARHLSDEHTSNDERITPSAQLMLFLELMSFIDLYGVTPTKRQRDVASRIAHKFFLPTKVDNRLQPPLFDFHHIVADASLRHLEFVLGGSSGSIPRNIFVDFQKAVVDSLTGAPFLSFLASSECSRMRGYLRATAPYVNLPLHALFESLVGDKPLGGAKNSFAYILLFLICQLEKEPTGEHDFSEGESSRMFGAASGLCCAVYIRKTLIPAAEGARKNRETGNLQKMIQACEKLWEYIAPGVGALEISSKSIETETPLHAVRELLLKAGDAASVRGSDALEKVSSVVDALLDPKLTDEARRLADELLYDYAVNVHTNFREHKCHEWLCSELCKVRGGDPALTSTEELPTLPQGCIKRLLRRIELPPGVSSHKPSYQAKMDSGKINNTRPENVEDGYPNADYAVVFGTSVGMDMAAQMPIPGIEHSDIRRYSCLPVALNRDPEYDSFSEDPVPPTFESYAVTPPTKAKHFGNMADKMRFSSDGWEISLVSFIIPNAESSSNDASDSALYCVSLVFQQNLRDGDMQATNPIKTQLVFREKPRSEVVHTPEKKTDGSEKEVVYDEHGAAIDVNNFASPISFETPKKSVDGEVGIKDDSNEMARIVQVSSGTPRLNERLLEGSWIERTQNSQGPLTIGLALVSRRNVIVAMRDTLSCLVRDYSRNPDSSDRDGDSLLTCGALVEVLGAFSYQDVETASLRCILEPYLRSASAPWVDRPLRDQKDEFESSALKQLTHCLTPTPLALLFVTALLEQKIVLSSSRMSVLHAAASALVSMLRPLKWSHLMVPLVPSALANDLIQYPAPFILGIPSHDNMELLNHLPTDVTLVDLDVGRVILAPAFAHDNEMVRGTEDAAVTMKALRSQVLYLAQALGSAFGACLSRETWCCDSPSLSLGDGGIQKEEGSSPFDNFRSLVRSFTEELLSGVTSCCYWIEEATQGYGTNTSSEESTVLFDEDRFFHIKNVRATKRYRSLFMKDKTTEFALSLDDFDLVVESILRVQSISTYISSQDRTQMLYY